MIALPEWISDSEESGHKDGIVIAETADGQPISIPKILTSLPQELDDDVIARIHEKVMALPKEQKTSRNFGMIVAAETLTIFVGDNYPQWLEEFIKRVKDLNLPI